MIDLHSHILPNLDDGAAPISRYRWRWRAQPSANEIEIRARGHTPTCAATTRHHPPRWSKASKRFAASSRRLRFRCRSSPAARSPWTCSAELDDDDLRRFGLGGNPSFLLLETPDFGWPLGLEQTLFELRLRGFGAVLAHPERNVEVPEDPGRLTRLIETGTLVQVTAASVDGRLGPNPQRTAGCLIELGLVHMIASDAHAPAVRKIGLGAAARKVGDVRLADWLTGEVPGAVVAGSGFRSVLGSDACSAAESPRRRDRRLTPRARCPCPCWR